MYQRSPIGIRAYVQRLSLSLALLSCAPAYAQEYRATISGRVTDEQRAILPGVIVTATNINTNVSTSSTTNENGLYSITQLTPGQYRLSAELQGFSKFVREGITLQTADKATIHVQLPIGTVTEVITVAAALTAAETNRSTIAQTMDNKRVSELPLNGRQVYMLLQQTPGTLFTQKSFGNTGFSGTRAWDSNGAVSIHGSRTNNNEFLIDGAPNSATGGWQYAPLVDAIEEFKVQTASVDASYGRTSGGIVNMTMKSGTNALRGTAILVYRGNALDAGTTQNNRLGLPKRDHLYSDYGGTLGGPIVRDKTFFMGYYEGFYENIPFPRTVSVPTDAQRRGDFSQTFNAQGQLVQIYDPLTTRPDPARPGRFIRDPFPGNVIPSDRLSPAARALMQYYPQPNNPGDPFTARGNFAASPNVAQYRYNSYMGRVDHIFNPNHRLFISNTSNWGQEYRNGNGFPPPATRGEYPKRRNHYMTTVDDVLTLSNRLVVNVRASVDRFSDSNPRDYANLTGDIGIRPPFGAVEPAQFPQINIDDFEGMFPGAFFINANNIYSVNGSISRSAGKHLTKLGGEFRSYRLNRINFGDGTGRFQFQRGFTQRDPQQGEQTAGNAFATFLLGYPSGETWVDQNASSARQYVYYAAYIQDDWQLSPKLTLNLGLRYDVQLPPTERYDRLTTGFDLESANPFQVPGLSLRGGPVFVSDGRRSPYKTDWTGLQPRLSASYRLTDAMILRGNFGRSMLPLTGDRQESIQQTSFSQRTSFISSIQTGIPFNTLDNPNPEGLLAPTSGTLGLGTGIGTGITFNNTEFSVPYTNQWMAGLSWELPFWNLSLDAAYVGNKTSGLSTSRDINRWSREEQNKSIERLGGNANYLNEQVPNPFAGLVPGTALNNATTARSQLLRPMPQFNGITIDRLDNGWADYHALELSVNRRFTRGLQVGVNYAFMRRNEKLDYLTAYDVDPIVGLNVDDQPHRLSITALYELPFGAGKAIGGGATGLVNALIGGWQVNVLGEIESGKPVGIPGNYIYLDGDFANLTLPDGEQSLNKWFDNSTPANPRPDGTYAWAPLPPNDDRVTPIRQGHVRQPVEPQWALSLFKNTRVGRLTTQLGIEAFNAFNTPIYGGPNTDPNNVRFGQITPDQINFPRQVQIRLRVLF
jgi:hypothetical protein